MSENFRKKGFCGEDSAADFLASHNYTIIERNYYAGRTGEIDIIAEKENCVVFIEVKTRDTEAFGGGFFSLNKKKIRTLKKAAQVYLARNNQYDKNRMFRFDLIVIRNGEIVWVKDVIR